TGRRAVPPSDRKETAGDLSISRLLAGHGHVQGQDRVRSSRSHRQLSLDGVEEVSIKAGDLVEVLPREELLATLTREGTLDKMPFQPEMLKYCGNRFRVSKVAHKTCDTAYRTGARSLNDTYHLEDLRCDGSAHGGCQATCLFFWRGAWLRKVEEGKPS